jgi:RNA recognition motif-containing protein
MTTKLFVRSLAFQTTSDTIHRAFAPFGQLAEAKVATEREDPSKSRGFAFVSYFNPDDAARAKEQMDGTEIDGRRIIVDFSTPPGAAPMAGGGGQTRQLAPPAAQAPRAAYPPPGASAPPSGRGRSRSPPRHQAPPARYQAPAAAAPPAREPDVARIYVTGLPKGTTEDALAAHFGVIGQIGTRAGRPLAAGG